MTVQFARDARRLDSANPKPTDVFRRLTKVTTE